MSVPVEDPEDCWAQLLEAQSGAGNLAELLPVVLEELGQLLHAEVRPSPVNVALVVGDVGRLVRLLEEQRDILVGAVRGIGARLAS